MKTKKIIQRNLSLNQKYTLMNTNYISLVDGFGCTCDNCGKLIANIATVKGENDSKVYSVGFDCMETFLINNNLLDGKGVDYYNNVTLKCLPKIKKLREYVKEFIKNNPQTLMVEIAKSDFFNNWVNIYFHNGFKKFWNSNEKIKVMDFDMLLASLKTINNNVQFVLTHE